ncbi:hypothetical protein [Verrucosispora sp. WMMC514]|uniref:hypothetical protein n=1 Tax=Verrucosispora sp. WMMC514 TaxID=3015156 RepID=UPI00248B73B9|nr:hypothetical protein [Verrucosispora sp. WMMC514]WBB94164.1 hypothetical protein O7597_15045 [Verrucosispora sp. WMMC514]
MDREHWRSLAARHGRCDDEPRRCRDCAAYWPCGYRLRADRELSGTTEAFEAVE